MFAFTDGLGDRRRAPGSIPATVAAVIGESLGPYRIDSELGSGGMGSVFRATGPDGVVALKVMHAHLLEGGDAAERFRREVEIGKTIRHPNVVTTFDGGEIDGRHYLSMEYVEGQTLAELRAELERVPEELCRHIGREVSKGLAAIHAAGAVHRDVKPENVLITPAHVVKIMDLGVARSMDDALRLSQTGAFVGSLHYAAPEQLEGGGKGLDGRADLHALGLVLYELSSDVNPYDGDEVGQVIRLVLSKEPRRLGEINPQLSAFFEEVVHCLLAKDRDERFATASDLLAVLESGEDCQWWRARARALQLNTRRPIRRIRIPRETAVYGRDDEIAVLRALYECAKAGEGNVVFVEGEAGIGKSRLVDELIGRLQRDGEDLNFLCGSYPPGGAAAAEGGFSSAYRAQFGEAGSATYLPENQVLVPAFDALLRGEGAPPDAQVLSKGSLQTCFVRATQTLAAERTTVVLIEDLHFAPEEGRSLFTSLAMSAPGHRVLFVGTARPGVSQDWLAGLTRLDQTSQLPLQRLGAKDLARLLQDTLHSEQLASDLGTQIAIKSDGNPFFVFEILRGLRDGQFIRQTEEGTWIGTQVIDEIEIPSSVLDLVNARVSGLSQQDRDVLDVAACWGFEFDPALIAEVTGTPRIPLFKQLAQIERAHRLVRSSGRRFAFDHHQVQEALYGSLPEVLREEYHAALADALATRTNAADTDPAALDGALCVDICEHFLKGARGEAALRYLPAAETHLTKGYLEAQVAALTGRALAIPGLLTGVARAKVLLRRVAALIPLGRPAITEECAREAERLAAEAGDQALQIRAARTLGRALLGLFRNEEAAAAQTRALDLALASGDREAEADATVNLGAAFRSGGRLPEAREHLERGLALCAEIGYRNCEARAAGGLGLVCWDECRLVEAHDHIEHGLALSREAGDRQLESNLTSNLGIIHWSAGRMPESRECYLRSIAISRQIGNRVGEANALGNLGLVFGSEGRLRESLEHQQQCLALSREVGSRALEVNCLGNLAGAFYAGTRSALGSELGSRSLSVRSMNRMWAPMSCVIWSSA